MSVSARYPPLRSRGRARSADSQRGRFGGRGVGERRMVADGGAPDCGTPPAGNARARSLEARLAPTKISHEKPLGSHLSQQSGHARLAPTMSALLAVARASARRVASHHRRDAAPALRCMSSYPPHMVRPPPSPRSSLR